MKTVWEKWYNITFKHHRSQWPVVLILEVNMICVFVKNMQMLSTEWMLALINVGRAPENKLS